MQQDHERLQQAIIGSMTLWPDAIGIAESLLTAQDFYNEKCRQVFRFLLEKGPCDAIVLEQGLRGKVAYDEILAWQLLDVSPAFVSKYCLELKEISMKLEMFDMAGRLRTGFQSMTSTEMVEQMERMIARLAAPSSREPVSAKDMMLDAARRLKHRYENRGKVLGIPYGFHQLDLKTCGMQRGDLIVVAGRPSMGKSAFAVNVMENACAAGYAALMFSLEMSTANVADRMISSRGSVLYGKYRSGNVESEDFPRMARCSEEISSLRLKVDDTPGIVLREIKSKARKQKRSGLDLIVVDYLQMIPVQTKETRALAVGEVSRGMKQLARELDCAVILLSQLNRAVDSRPDKRPQMSDLRDSGEIEQDADVILFPYRPGAYCPKCKARIDDGTHDLRAHQAEAEVIIEKQRNGERNIAIPMIWSGEYQRFEELVEL